MYSELQNRGLIAQITDESLKDHLSQPRSLYCGFDPTGDSLHVGSLLPLLTLRRFQMAGHRPIIVLGGATGMIGDPSGKSQERNLLTQDQVNHNLKGIRKVVEKFLDFSPTCPNPAKIVNNYDFYQGQTVLDFLREVGKHFTINLMIQKDSVRTRMNDRDHGISYTEFSYMLLQAYDFYKLFELENCTLQIGATDQWGNITAGTELIRKKTGLNADGSHKAFGLTHPLITRSDGLKFGKTEQGTVWLTEDRTSPYAMYQFFMGAPDDKVIEWLKLLTFVPLEEIQTLEQQLQTEPEKKASQKRLATEITKLVHGEDGYLRAQKATEALFGSDLKTLDLQTLQDAFSAAPSKTLEKEQFQAGYSLIDALVDLGLFSSKGNARKEIQVGGVYLNQERVTDEKYTFKDSDLFFHSMLVIRKGKKHYGVIKVTSSSS